MPTAETAERPRVWYAFAAIVVLLAAYNVTRALWLPGRFHTAGTFTVGALSAAIAFWAGLTRDEMGLARRHIARGVLWGGATFALVGAGLGAAAAFPQTAHLFDDKQVKVPLSGLLVSLLWTIPVGTVIPEELAFRGALFGLANTRLRTVWAVVVSSALFGCWHIAPTINSSRGNAQLSGFASSNLGLTLTVAGTVLLTGCAGAVFCWLRIRAKHLLAPMGAHYAVNSLAFLTAWLVVHH